jgi:hypothetical protein
MRARRFRTRAVVFELGRSSSCIGDVVVVVVVVVVSSLGRVVVVSSFRRSWVVVSSLCCGGVVVAWSRGCVVALRCRGRVVVR